MTIRITGDGPKITATGSGSTVLVEITTAMHDPGSFSGVHNDLSGRTTAAAHPATAVTVDASGFDGNLAVTDNTVQKVAQKVDDLVAGGGGAVDSVDGRTGVVTLNDLYQTVGFTFAVDGVDTFPLVLTGSPRSVSVAAPAASQVSFRAATANDDGQRWHIYAASESVVVTGLPDGDGTKTIPAQHVGVFVGVDLSGTYLWSAAEVVPVNPTSGGATTLDDLTDVDTTTDPPAQDDVLAWDAVNSEWSPATLSSTPDAHASTHANGGSDEISVDASQITTGTVATARLGSGTADSTTFLRGDQTYATPSSGIADPGGANDDFLQRKSGAWTYRTPAQVGTDLNVTSKPGRTVFAASRWDGSGSFIGTVIAPGGDSNRLGTMLVAAGVQIFYHAVHTGQTLTSLYIGVSATGLSAGQGVQVACYNEAADGGPGTRAWVQTLTVGTSTGAIGATGLSLAMPNGKCWITFLNLSTNAGTVTVRRVDFTESEIFTPAAPVIAYGNMTGIATSSADLTSTKFSVSPSSTVIGHGTYTQFPLIGAQA